MVSQLQICEVLKESLGKEAVVTSAEEIQYYSQDYFGRGQDVEAILRPVDMEELSQCVSLCGDLGLAIFPRGGGYSYTSGYLATQRGVVIDTGRMNKILEINADDNYVTVQAGCTWAQLNDALEEYGLRTPFWGPFSGLRATVGGSVSQGTISLGSSEYGVSSTSVLDMEVVLAGGQRIKTGVSGQPNHLPFFRNYGPDITGLFCSDCGAFGVKGHITLQLMKRPRYNEGLSFGFTSFADCAEAAKRVAAENVAADSLGTSRLRLETEAAAGSLKDNLSTLWKIGRSGNSVLDGLSRMTRVAFAGKSFAKNYHCTMNYVVEGSTKAIVDAKAQIVRNAIDIQGVEIANTVPTAIRAEPFKEYMMLSATGQRQVPPSAILPFSKIEACHDEFFRALATFEDRMVPHNMKVMIGTATIGTTGFLFEPVIAWDDQADEFHKRHTPARVIDSIGDVPANPEARQLASEVRQLMIETAYKYGGVHLQIGKTYPYMRDRDQGASELVKTIKGFVDPNSLMNPGSLGLPVS